MLTDLGTVKEHVGTMLTDLGTVKEQVGTMQTTLDMMLAMMTAHFRVGVPPQAAA